MATFGSGTNVLTSVTLNPGSNSSQSYTVPSNCFAYVSAYVIGGSSSYWQIGPILSTTSNATMQSSPVGPGTTITAFRDSSGGSFAIIQICVFTNA